MTHSERRHQLIADGVISWPVGTPRPAGYTTTYNRPEPLRLDAKGIEAAQRHIVSGIYGSLECPHPRNQNPYTQRHRAARRNRKHSIQ